MINLIIFKITNRETTQPGGFVNLYKKDGVDVVAGDNFSSFAAKACRDTFSNSRFVEVIEDPRGHFRGPRRFRLKNLPRGYTLDMASDGIGTKVMVIDAAGSYAYAAQDLVAMVCGDITRYGGIPLIINNILDVSRLGNLEESANEDDRDINHAFRTMIEGLREVCRKQHLVAFKGETAELGPCVASENVDAITEFNWGATAFGVYHPDMMITGDSLAPGQQVIALQERGFRSNGISSVRKAFKMQFGSNFYNLPSALPAIRAAATPSALYDQMLVEANGWYSEGFEAEFLMHLVVHVTGGAIRGKFAEDMLFPLGLSATLDDLWDPPEIMRKCAEWRKMGDQECYETWNCGQGVLVVVDKQYVDSFVQFCLDRNINAKWCGEIEESKNPKLTIVSKFSGQELVFQK